MAATSLIGGVSDLLREDTLPYTLIGGLAVIVLVSWVSYLNDPLRSIPGPFWARWSPAWLVYWAREGIMHRKMIDMHEKYGGLVRTAPNEVSFSNPEYLKVVYGAGSDFYKSDWYSVWQGRRKWDLFGERSEAIHRAQRRLVSQIYSLSNMKKLEPYVDVATTMFLNKLKDMAGKEMNMTKWAQLYAFDVIGEVTFSKTFGFLEAGEDIHGAFTLIDNSLRSAAWVGYVPWVYWANVRFAPIIGNRLGVLGRQNGLLTFAAKAIKERKERGSDHQDVLDQLFEVQKEKPELDDICITSMVASNVFAGSDSTSISVSAFIYHIIKNPQYRARLVAEIDEAAKANNIKHGEIFPIDVGNNMPYLQACLQEAIRCHPAVGMNLGRVAPPQGVEIDGTYIPGGTVVGANAWVVHQHKETFGEDADEFRPDRWLEEPERVSQMKRAFFSFGAGSRFCIGKNIAWLELSKMAPSLFHDFEIELVNPDASLQEIAMSFVKLEGLQVTVSPRKGVN